MKHQVFYFYTNVRGDFTKIRMLIFALLKQTAANQIGLKGEFMKDTSIIMDAFMQELSNNKYEKDCQPNDGPDITDDFLMEKLTEYSNLLDTGIVRATLQE